MKDKEFANAIHMEVHAVRRIVGYKPSVMDRNVSKFVIERFSKECIECKEIGEKIKNKPEKKGFFSKLQEAID